MLPSHWQPKWWVEHYSPGKMWSFKWKHRTEWVCWQKTEKQWKPSQQQRTEKLSGRRPDKFLDSAPGNSWLFSGLWQHRSHEYEAICDMLNQGQRIHTSVWFQFGVESNGSASDKATPPKHCQRWGRWRYGEREKEAKTIRGHVEKQT